MHPWQTLRGRGVSIIVSVLALLLGGYGLYISGKNVGVPSLNIDTTSLETLDSPEIAAVSDIAVFIHGAVAKPGVHKLRSGMRIIDALNLAGGLSSGADLAYLRSTFNLAQKVSDEMVIYVPWSGEVLLKSSVSEDIAITDDSSTDGTQNPSSGVLNINSCTKDELMALKGIGSAYADKIINARPIKSYDDLYDTAKVPKSVLEMLRTTTSL